MLRWARASVSVIALVLSACAPPPEEVTSAAASSDASGEPTTSAGPGTLTAVTTTPADESSDTSSRETTSDTTTSAVDTTTDEGSSSGGSSSSSGPPPGCTGPEDCDSNQDCVGDRCVDACGGTWGEGSYDYCLTDYGDFDTATLCGAGHLCVYWGDPIDQTACALQGCASACDCPPPPATGNAVVTCGDITDPDEMTDCYLSCQNGETCPDGMVCTNGGTCVTDVPPLPVYGDCGNLAADCTPPAFCVAVPGGESVCTTGCNDAMQCPMAIPPGGTADPACTDVVPGTLGLECYLDCIGGETCPDGMTCINGTLCMWPD